MLLVHGHGHALGQAAQQVAAFGHVLVGKAQQALHFTPAEHLLVQLDLGALALDVQRHLSAARKFLGHLQRQLCGRGGHYQRLAARNEHPHGAVIGGDLAGLDVLVEFADELIALIQQVVG